MSLSPEREKEIRSRSSSIYDKRYKHQIAGKSVAEVHIKELLAEIDRLRAELNQASKDYCEISNQLNGLHEVEKERDKLAESNKQIHDEMHMLMGVSGRSFREENQNLRAENEKLKLNQLFEASSLFDENQKLGERVEYFRSILTTISNKAIWAIPIMRQLASEALAQDNEIEKK